MSSPQTAVSKALRHLWEGRFLWPWFALSFGVSLLAYRFGFYLPPWIVLLGLVVAFLVVKAVISHRPPIRRVHPVFGSLLYFGEPTGPGYWEAEIDNPVHGSIGLGIDVRDARDPSQAQVDFYRDVADHLDSWVARCQPQLGERFEVWLGRPLNPDWRRDLRWTHLSIPCAADNQAEWTIGFECTDRRSSLLFTVFFRDGKVVGVSSDG